MVSTLLARHRLRSTPARRAALTLLHDRACAVARADIEAVVDADRVTLYRTLVTLEERGLIHKVRGIDGEQLYALCGEACGPDVHRHEHAHFHCNDCGDTYCLPDSGVVEADPPPGYRVVRTEVSFAGVCKACVETGAE